MNDELKFVDIELRNEKNRKDKSIISSIEDEGETAISEGKITVIRNLKELDEEVGRELLHLP